MWVIVVYSNFEGARRYVSVGGKCISFSCKLYTNGKTYMPGEDHKRDEKLVAACQISTHCKRSRHDPEHYVLGSGCARKGGGRGGTATFTMAICLHGPVAAALTIQFSEHL